jgi:hypothetical protein
MDSISPNSATEFSIEDNNGYLLTFAEDEK